MKPTDGLVRGAPVTDTGRADHRAGRPERPSATSTTCSASRSTPRLRGRPSAGRSTATPRRFDELEPKTEMFETGIKVIDLLEPVRAGRQDRHVRRRRRRQDRLIQEMIYRIAKQHGGVSVFAGVGRADPRGQRPVPGDERVRRHRQDGAGVRPDGRAAGRAPAGGPVRADDGRVLPRRDAPGRAAVHRQHLPLHAGRLRGVHAARPDAVARWATSRPWPTRWARSRSGSPRPGATRSRRCRPSTCRPTTSPTRRRTPRSPTSTPPPCCRGRSPSSASTRRSTRWTPPRASSTRGTSARSTTASPAGCRRSCSATRTSRTSSPSSASTSCPRRTRSS